VEGERAMWHLVQLTGSYKFLKIFFIINLGFDPYPDLLYKIVRRDVLYVRWREREPPGTWSS
jgi:hypothetical protein